MSSESQLSHTISSNIDFLSAWIESQMAYRDLPGLSIGVVHGQELIWAKGFGLQDIEKQVRATPQTVYRIASITKLFTSTAIMILRDAGKLQLDDPVRRHVPWFEIQNPFDGAPDITIRHLLTHTSGLPREAPFPYWSDARFPTAEEVREKLPEQRSALPPEKRWKYSNLALSMAGEIVAAASGQEYADFIEQRILDPLNMKSTSVRSPDPSAPALAMGYGRKLPDGNRGDVSFTDSKGITAAANMATSVEDLAKFAMLQFCEDDDERILRHATRREMQRVHWLDPDWKAGWGIGFRISRQRGKTFIGHGGAVPGYRTHLRLCPDDRIGVIVLTNSDDGNPERYIEKASAWLSPAILRAQSEPDADVDPAWQTYVGRYRNAWNDMQVLVLDGELVLIDPSLPDPKPTLVKLKPAGEHSFKMESKSGSLSIGELAVFEVDDSGAVKELKAGQSLTWPIEAW
ncbi:MAG: serine hydrolase [Planctomycetota bacterium]|jgi:CubicO group peptidase (beta-lactamase class C family)|nr:serine hydrolase [Planctomycetota bacterium]MDP6506133.1 serine hydrolase [Planctomycetota bacterium]